MFSRIVMRGTGVIICEQYCTVSIMMAKLNSVVVKFKIDSECCHILQLKLSMHNT